MDFTGYKEIGHLILTRGAWISPNRRLHWAAKKRIQQAVLGDILQQLSLLPVEDRMRITLKEPRKRALQVIISSSRRNQIPDIDNAWAGLKHTLDCLKKIQMRKVGNKMVLGEFGVGVIWDDDADHLELDVIVEGHLPQESGKKTVQILIYECPDGTPSQNTALGYQTPPEDPEARPRSAP